jgi:predicted ATPase with chaperone activity
LFTHCHNHDFGSKLHLNVSLAIDNRFDGLRGCPKLAQTIADLEESEEIQSLYLSDVLQYRPKLMMG